MQEALTIDEIREALVLSCEYSPDCSREELAASRSGKQPVLYDEETGLHNAEKIMQQKGMFPAFGQD
jgi:hypothetical protein